MNAKVQRQVDAANGAKEPRENEVSTSASQAATKLKPKTKIYYTPLLQPIQEAAADRGELEPALEKGREELVRCELCPHNCLLKPGQTGFCRVRRNIDGRVRATRDGYTSSIALDPIEKKPLSFFHPGTQILSVGFFGCNMRCPFCQNFEISMHSDEDLSARGRYITKEELVELAVSLRARGNIGIAFTYNEPLVHFEWIKECFALAREAELETVLVTNGNFNEPCIREIAPLTTAWNIDLKCFTEDGYRSLGGDLETVKRAIVLAAESSHVEITTLVVPGLSDDPQDMAREAAWLAGINPGIPLHLTRFFPRYHSLEEAPTDPVIMRRLAKIAREHLQCVELGNL